MPDVILAAEPVLRLSAFAGVLVLMMVWELAAPRRRREIPRLVRWSNNLALVVIDTAILRLAFPLLAVAFALWADEAGWGLFNALGCAALAGCAAFGPAAGSGDLTAST